MPTAQPVNCLYVAAAKIIRAGCLLILTSYHGFSQNIPVTARQPDSAAMVSIYRNSTIWQGSNPKLMLKELAAYAAPVLWFSPDEPNLKSKAGKMISIPSAFPFEKETERPVVYYKVLNIFTDEKLAAPFAYKNDSADKGNAVIDLSLVNVFYLDYYFYYASEMGLHSHAHDIESVVMKMVVDRNPLRKSYRIRVENINGRAHGLYWYNNLHIVDTYTKFPVTILVEEGKHASCPDANGDGVYTPSYDVNVRTNDAWGIRDIIRNGNLFTGAYQSWMTKPREPSTIVSPPLPADSPVYDEFANDNRKLKDKTVYELRPWPEAVRLSRDKRLEALIKEKQPVNWPEIKSSKKPAKKIKGIQEDADKHPVTIAYRQEENGGLTYIMPLLVFKNVPSPMTGGWLINKFYLGEGDYANAKNGHGGDRTIFGHMIMHMSSASRWLDPYIGLGYEINDYDEQPGQRHYKTDMAAEFGFKIRFNFKTKTVFKKPKFIGIRLGYRVTGFAPVKESGLLLEIGAGAW